MLLLRVNRASSASASHHVPIRPCAPFLPFPTCSTAAKERKRMSVIRVLLCKGENKRRGGRGAQGEVRKRGGKVAVRRRCELTFSRPARASPSQTVPSAACCAPSVCAQGGARKKTKCWRRGVRTRSGKKGRASPSSRRPLRTMLSRPRGLLPSERSCAQGRQQQHAQGQTRIRGGVPRGAKCTRKYRAATLCAAHAPLFIFRVLEGTLIALMEGTLSGSRGGESENETFTDDSRFIHGSLATPCRPAPVRPGRLSLVGLSLVTLCPSPSP